MYVRISSQWLWKEKLLQYRCETARRQIDSSQTASIYILNKSENTTLLLLVKMAEKHLSFQFFF